MLLLLDSFDELESSAKSQHGFLCNFHFIAKSAFSNAIAEENLARVKGALNSPAVSHISIKGRAFYLLGTEFARMQDMLSSSLKGIFAHASACTKSQGVAKSITLDMEEHRFIALHVAAFMEAAREYGELELGIALQAYIPESSTMIAMLKMREMSGDLSALFEPDTDCMRSNAMWLSQILESTLEPKRIYLRDSRGASDGAMERIYAMHDRAGLLGEVAFATSAQIQSICQNLPQVAPIENALVQKDSGVSGEMFGGLCEIFECAITLPQARRGEIIKLAWLEIGKYPAATDMEISQIITQLRCYPKILQEMIATTPALRLAPRGLGLVEQAYKVI